MCIFHILASRGKGSFSVRPEVRELLDNFQASRTQSMSSCRKIAKRMVTSTWLLRQQCLGM